MTSDESNLYGGRDPRDIPAYSVPAAARLAGIPATTLRSWVLGRSYATKTGVRRAAGLIKLPAANKGGFLSFTNLVEVHVLAAMRREHELKLETVRNAIRYLERESAQDHPLAYEKFRTNGVDLFVERYGDLVNARATARWRFDRRSRRASSVSSMSKAAPCVFFRSSPLSADQSSSTLGARSGDRRLPGLASR